MRWVRFLLAGKTSEETYDRVRNEWQEMIRHIEANRTTLEHDTARHLDDLGLALILLTRIHELYPRLADRQRAMLLQIVASCALSSESASQSCPWILQRPD